MGSPIRPCIRQQWKETPLKSLTAAANYSVLLYYNIIPYFIYAEGQSISWGNLIVQNLISIWLRTRKFKYWNAHLKGMHLLDVKALEQFA